MPLLIAAVVGIAGAMIYLFSSYGNTTDTIKLVAMKPGIMTEINNIKDGVKNLMILESDNIAGLTLGSVVASEAIDETMRDSVFPVADTSTGTIGTEKWEAADGNATAVYRSISFGNKMFLTVKPAATGERAEIIVDIHQLGGDNAGFLEKQLKNDLSPVADVNTSICITAQGTSVSSGYDTTSGHDGLSTTTLGKCTGNKEDGIFSVRFKDLQKSNN